MTYAELQRRMSSTELELWMGLSLVRAEECPSCGVHAGDMMKWQNLEVKCPVCKHQYTRNRFIEDVVDLHDKHKEK